MNIELRPRYGWRLGDATSQWFNAAILGGDANESISGRAARITAVENKQHRGWNTAYRWINKAMSRWQENHCMEAFLNDVARAQALTYYARTKRITVPPIQAQAIQESQ